MAVFYRDGRRPITGGAGIVEEWTKQRELSLVIGMLRPNMCEARGLWALECRLTGYVPEFRVQCT